MLLPGVLVLFVYTILPLLGNVMAFQNFQPILGFFKSKWVGLDNFKYMFMKEKGRTFPVSLSI